MCLTYLTFRGTIAVRLSLINSLTTPTSLCGMPRALWIYSEHLCVPRYWVHVLETVTLYLLVFHVLFIFAAHHSHWATSLSASFSFFIPQKKRKKKWKEYLCLLQGKPCFLISHSSQLMLMKFNRLKVFKIRIWLLDRGENKFVVEQRICREYWSFFISFHLFGINDLVVNQLHNSLFYLFSFQIYLIHATS